MHGGARRWVLTRTLSHESLSLSDPQFSVLTHSTPRVALVYIHPFSIFSLSSLDGSIDAAATRETERQSPPRGAPRALGRRRSPAGASALFGFGHGTACALSVHSTTPYGFSLCEFSEMCCDV